MFDVCLVAACAGPLCCRVRVIGPDTVLDKTLLVVTFLRSIDIGLLRPTAGGSTLEAEAVEGLWPPGGLEGRGGGAGLSHSLSELEISLH